MNDSNVNAGEFQVISLKIRDVFGNTRVADVSLGTTPEEKDKATETKFLIYRFTLNESIRHNAITGSAYVLDGVGLFYDFPLKCEETLEIEIEDWYGVRRREKMMITSITNLRPTSGTDNSLLEYRLEFVSWGGWIAATSGVRRAYADYVSSMVQDVFDTYYKHGPRRPGGDEIPGTTKSLSVEPTNGEQQLIVPYYNALETMNFFARNAYGDKSSLFYFFEREDGFFFVSDDWLLKNSASNIQTFSFQAGADHNPGDTNLQRMQGIINYSVPSAFDVGYHLSHGTYYKELREADTQSRSVDVSEFKYYDHYGRFTQNLQGGNKIRPSNTPEFVATFFKQGKRIIMPKDYPSIGSPGGPMVREQPFRSESIMESWSLDEHYNSNKIHVTVYGRVGIRPGDQVSIELPKMKAIQEKIEFDEARSGTYLIESISNFFEGNSFVQDLTLMRGGIAV